MLDAPRSSMNQTTHPATAAEVFELLGDVSPDALERLLATTASVDEIAAELAAIEDEEGFGEQSHADATPRLREVRAVLEELAFERIEASEDERDIAST